MSGDSRSWLYFELVNPACHRYTILQAGPVVELRQCHPRLLRCAGTLDLRLVLELDALRNDREGLHVPDFPCLVTVARLDGDMLEQTLPHEGHSHFELPMKPVVGVEEVRRSFHDAQSFWAHNLLVLSRIGK